MSRRSVAAMGMALLTVTIGAPGAGASGGGGCPPPITNGSATKAIVKGWCYEPTVTYIRPGDTITWVNKDPAPHSVTGANRAWGTYDKLKPGKKLSYTFERAGAYPYYCLYHLGMVGTMVVWDGEVTDLLGPRGAPAVHQVRPRIETVAASAAVPVQPTRSDGSTTLAFVVIGAPAAIGMWLLARRTRRHRSTGGGGVKQSDQAP